MTVFLGCGFAAKYREGGGNFSVPLQWMFGLHRLKQDAIWLELLPATNDHSADTEGIREMTRLLTSDSAWTVSVIPIRDGVLVARKT